jgi:hypothetical protein
MALDSKASVAPMRWIIWCLFLTVLTSFWATFVYQESASRIGAQSVFRASTPLLSDWYAYSVDSLVVLQGTVSVIGIWRVKKGRWWLALLLLSLWFVAFTASQIRYG